MRLSANLDLAAAAPLWSNLCAARHTAIEIDASGVERLGGLCLQILLAAQSQWRSDGVAFAIVNPAASFADVVKLMDAGRLLPEIAA